MKELTDTKYDKINVFSSRSEMGVSAGKQVEKKLVELQDKKEEVRIVFAAAPSQNELLDYLSDSSLIDWKKVTAFHMDEYIGLPEDSPQSFSHYLNKRLFEKVNLKSIHLIDGTKSSENEIKRYAELLQRSAIDIICLGIGENGHIAFNDPHVADFKDDRFVTNVTLDTKSRQQQVNDGCFSNIEEVPKQAITLTVPALMSASFLYCVVPGSSKRKAVHDTLYGPIEHSCPASILRTHSSCMFFFDRDAYGRENVFEYPDE